MKKILFSFVLSLSFFITNGQAIRELKIGDTLPSMTIVCLEGGKLKTEKLSSIYKSQFLVLDFWATWCAACIRAMSEADSVISKFNGRIKLLPITYEDSNTVQHFVEKSQVLGKLNLQYIVNDSLLMGGYFKFRVLPHEVWIDTNGIVKAITYPDEITYDNLLSLVRSDKLSIEEKVDDISFDISKPMDATNASILYRSLLTRYRKGISSQMGAFLPSFDEKATANRFIAINKDFLSLYYAAYSHNQGLLNFNRIELHVKDSVALHPFVLGTPSREIIQQNCYCYELILPQKGSRNFLYSYLFEELNHLSRFHASIEKRKRECWVLININKNKNPPTNRGKPRLNWDKGFISKMTNQTMDVLTAYLNWNMQYPVVDETGFRNLLNMELHISATTKNGHVYFDVAKVKKSLNKYGFDITKSVRDVEVLVIRDKQIAENNTN